MAAAGNVGADEQFGAGWPAGLIRRPWVLIALCLGTWAILVVLWGRWGFDDPFITFRYAHNLRAGHGLIYNQGERILSTTAPLYAVLLAGLSWAWPDLPSLGNAVSALGIVLAAAALAAWSWSASTVVALTGALLLVVNPLLLTTFGAETCLYLAAVLAGFYAYYRSHLVAAACLLALAVMLRPDGALAALAVWVVHAVRQRRMAWRPVLLYAALVGCFYGALWLYYGSPIPVTLLAKTQQGGMAVSQTFGRGLTDLALTWLRQPRYWPYLVLALVGATRLASWSGLWLPLLVWTALYASAFVALGVGRYFWYYGPLVPAGAVLVAEGVAAVARAGRRLVGTVGAARLLAAVLIAAVVAPLPGAGWPKAMRPDPRVEIYRQVGRWLADNTPSPASVGALEVGIIGYYSQRTMVDFAGLLQPEVARQLSPGSSYQDSARWAIDRYVPDYVAVPEAAFAGLTASSWFGQDYARLMVFGGGEAAALGLYQRLAAPR